MDEAANGQYALDYPRTSPPAHGGVAHVRMPGVTGVVVIEQVTVLARHAYILVTGQYRHRQTMQLCGWTLPSSSRSIPSR